MNKFILIGLGNPGKKYENTRHNAGKMFTAWLKEEGRKWKIVETDCFMNESGKWVKRWLKSQRPNQQPTTNNQQPILFIAHDDLDIPLGKFKIQFGKGPKLHKGIASIEQALGTTEFWRIRVGIENRKNKMATNGYNGSDYVLSNFRREERKLLKTDVFPKVQEELQERLKNDL